MINYIGTTHAVRSVRPCARKGGRAEMTAAEVTKNKFLEEKTIITHYEQIEKIFCIRSDFYVKKKNYRRKLENE